MDNDASRVRKERILRYPYGLTVHSRPYVNGKWAKTMVSRVLPYSLWSN